MVPRTRAFSVRSDNLAIRVQVLIQDAYKPGTGIVATVLGVLTLFLGASSVVVELRGALNTIWRAPAANGRTRFACLLGIVRARCYSFALILGIGFLLLVTLVLNAWIAAFGPSLLAIPEPVLELITFGVSFLVFALLFATTYKMLPDVRLKWSDVAIGACVTSLFFTIGRQLIALYLGKASFRSAYGAAGSLVVMLVWVYYSAQLFFLGAEFTKVYTRTFGSELTKTLDPGSRGDRRQGAASAAAPAQAAAERGTSAVGKTFGFPDQTRSYFPTSARKYHRQRMTRRR